MIFKSFVFCIVAVLLSSCILPNGAAKSTTSSKSTVAFTVNGSAVTTEELMKSPVLRQGFEQVLMLYGLKSLVAAQGISVDEKKLDEQLAEIKAEIIASGQTFEAMMEDRGTNEADYRENMRITLLVDELLESRFEYTDDDIKSMWEANPARFNNEYARENGLTDNERDVLTLEDVFDSVLEAFKRDRLREMSRDLQQEVIDNIVLKLNCISDLEERKFFEDLIINKKKSTYVAPETPEADGEAGVDESDHSSRRDGDPVSVDDNLANPCESTDDASDEDSGGVESLDDPEGGH